MNTHQELTAADIDDLIFNSGLYESDNDISTDQPFLFGSDDLDLDVEFLKTINPNEIREDDPSISNILNRSQRSSPSSPSSPLSSNGYDFDNLQAAPSSQKPIEQDELMALLENCELNETTTVICKSIQNMCTAAIKEEPEENFSSDFESSSSNESQEQQIILRKRKSPGSAPSECIFKPTLSKAKTTSKIVKNKKMKNCLHVWQYCRDLLKQRDECVEWLNPNEGIFKIKNQERIAQRWGLAKNRKNKMSYEKFSRGIRHSRDDGYFDPIPRNQNYGVKLVFKFGKSAITNCAWLQSIVNKC